ncbi:GNAT family N-acetyltransferase [Salinicoccus roseus]|uniref:GNAT family N-acetyltransferase n=1 Tax=Salinicoccus roseus TaxID=45670 RepID=UPI001EF47DF8|nr:GNAT family N-acetyltransferase [Salinicoccus roseus]MCG7332232.1 GNAT family N-acetyltransferase [Salinicoccus roseus]
MEIRAIEMRDIKQFLNLLVTLEENSKDDLYEDQPLNISNTETLLSSVLQNAKHQIFVARDNQRIVGYISLAGNHNEMTAHRANVSLGVLQTDQQNSIGRNLLNAAIHWAEENRIHRLELSIRDDFAEEIELYKALGFKKEGERVDALFIDGKYRNEIYLYRLIN